MRSTLLMGSAALVVLAGCHTPLYQPPASGATAELVVDRAEGAKAGRLWPFLFNGPRCEGRHHIGIIDFNSDETLTTTIIAKPETIIEMSDYDTTTRTSCDVKIQFDPAAGNRYRATWSRGGEQCFMRIERLVPGAGDKQAWIKEPSAGQIQCSPGPSFR